ncbi:hypothetical protein EYR40_002542 [Pleurotus pulmonarius]|nr:hypothetical protein EYR40_002542 [Pleurotus pulmonarius]
MLSSSSCPFSICVQNGNVFTAVNTDQFPDFPPLEYLIRPSDLPLGPEDTQQLSWATNEYPQLICIPKGPMVYQGPLLERLNYTSQSVPIVETQRSHFQLEEGLQKSWYELQQMFVDISSKLYQTTPYPSGQEYYPLPETFGFLRGHTSRGRAVACALRSRDAFVPLIATMKLFYHSMPHHGAETHPIEVVDWLIGQGTHPEVANRVSEVLWQFGSPSRGALIDPTKVRFLDYIYKFCSNPPLGNHAKPIPVWFYWGPLPDQMSAWHPPRTDVSMYCPTAQQLQQYLHRAPTSLPPPPPISDVSTAPVPDQLSRQHQGETMQAFFEREAQWAKKKERHESDAERLKRMDRVKAASKGLDPGKKGAWVFVWENDSGYDIRRHVGRREVGDIWSSFSESQRRYNSFRNEWDLCVDFDPAAIPDEDMDDDSFDDNDTTYAADPPSFPSRLSEVPASSHLASSYEHLLEDPEHSVAEASGSLAVPFDTFLRSFLGLLGASPPVSLSAATPLIPAKNVKGILGYSQVNITDNVQQSLVPFVSALLAKPPFLPKSCDLHPQSISPVDLSLLRPHVHRFSLGKDIRCRQFFKIGCITVEEKTGEDMNPPWHVVVEHAAIALFCTRFFPSSCQNVDTYTVVRYFVNHGIAFKTPVLRSVDRIVPIQSVVQYDYRRQGYQPTRTDYAHYEARRDVFLRTPRGRAAIAMGGIIWRLSRDVVDIADVLAGPTEQATIWTRTNCSDDEAYVDDALTEYELDLIIGNYKVSVDPNFEAELSWWPKHWNFTNTSLDMHIWTQNAEDWFQHRLERIRDGTAPLRTSREWKKSMMLLKKAGQLTKNFESLSQDVFPPAPP